MLEKFSDEAKLRQPRSFNDYLKEFESDPNTNLRAQSEAVRRPYGGMGSFRDQLRVGFETHQDRSLRAIKLGKQRGSSGETPVQVISIEIADSLVVFEVVKLLGRPSFAEEHDYVVMDNQDPNAYEANLVTVWRQQEELEEPRPGMVRVDSKASFL